MKIFLVAPKGTIVIAAYTREELAIVHNRCMLGTEVYELELGDTLPKIVREDLNEFEDSEDTPIVEISCLDDYDR